MNYERQIAYMHKPSFRPKAFTRYFTKKWKSIALALVGLALVVAGVFSVLPRLQEVDAARTGAVATVTINGTATSVVFVGGGDDHLYALDAASGNILWSTPLGDPTTNIFIWDSPFVFNNNVYIGTGTTGEGAGCALVAGQFF